MSTFPDKKWATHDTDLADNNVGGISEEDVRSILQFARTSYAMMGASNLSQADFTWTNNVPTLTADQPRYTKINSTVISAAGSNGYTKSEHWLTVGANGFTYSASAVSSRLIRFDWNVELWMQSPQWLTLAFYVLPSGSSWPTDTDRALTQRLYYVEGPTATTSPGQFVRTGPVTYYVGQTSGSSTIVLAPGASLVPVLEHHGPDGSAGNFKAWVNLTAHTAGAVDDWTIPAAYFTSTSNKAMETGLASVPARGTGDLG